MQIDLQAEVVDDGDVGLHWQVSEPARAFTLLIERTGAVPAYTSIRLGGATTGYRLNNLSRHQRYRLAVIAHTDEATTSQWLEITPRKGLPARETTSRTDVSQVDRLMVMPQDGRLTLFWQRSGGFVDKLLVEVLADGEQLQQIELEPEVSSLTLDQNRFAVTNGDRYGLRLHTCFAGARHTSDVVLATPAPQGEERAANRHLPQRHLVYPTLSLAPEIDVFGEGTEVLEQPSRIVCMHCRDLVQWRSYALVCNGCGAEYIPNGRGQFLDISRLRFGTCRCCMPKKILVQRAGSSSLTCAYSGKEYIRTGESNGHLLIEDLPFGLCQCCRPRRPLERVDDGQVCCSRSGEQHENQDGAWALLPSQPVFDATAIDDLLDAGLAEICATGVSRAH